MQIILLNQLLKKFHCMSDTNNFLCFSRCKIIIHQYFKCRKNQICQNILRKLFQMNRFSQINCNFLGVNTNTKQLYLQLQKLLTNTRLCHGNNLHTFIHKHLYGPLWKLIYPFIRTFSLIYLRFIDNIFFLYGQAVKQIQRIF